MKNMRKYFTIYCTLILPLTMSILIFTSNSLEVNASSRIAIVDNVIVDNNLNNENTYEPKNTEPELIDKSLPKYKLDDNTDQEDCCANKKLNITEDELELLTRLVFAEAGNQDEIGKRLVVDTVLNRLDSDRFPNNIHDVIYDVNQYSTASYLFSSKVNPTEDEYNIVLNELEDRYNYDVLFFRTKHYHTFGTPLFQHGAHYFSK